MCQENASSEQKQLSSLKMSLLVLHSSTEEGALTKKKNCYKLNFHQLAHYLFKNKTNQHDTNVSFHLFSDPLSQLHICQKGREQSRPE